MDTIDVLIDTDNALGTLESDPEDGLAIVMAIQSPELRVRAVTGVFGNCRLESVIANTTMLLREVGRPDIPFAAGFDAPLLPGHPAGHPSPAHERDAQLVEGGARPDRHAVDVIIETALASTTGLTLIGLGPLTNIAVAVRREPRLRDYVREIVVMGGGHRETNVTPAAEFNFWADPDSAHIVFESGLPIRMVGLDVCHRVNLAEDDLSALRAGGNLGTLAARCFDSLWWSPIYLYDTLTVAAAANPELLQCMPALVEIQRDHTASFGQSLVYWRNVRSNAKVAYRVDSEAFKALFRERVLAPLSAGGSVDWGLALEGPERLATLPSAPTRDGIQNG